MTRAALYHAHSGDPADRGDWHPLSAHLEGTGARAAGFLSPVGLAKLGEAAGLLHDLGKYTPEFQKRLDGGGRRVDHATAGAQVARTEYGPHLGKLLAFCIAGHHAGLADGAGGGGRISTLEERLKKEVPALDPVWKRKIALPQAPAIKMKPRDRGDRDGAAFSIAFLTRMVFSALVDADYLDTEAYYDRLENRRRERGGYPPLSDLSARLDAYLARRFPARADGESAGTVNAPRAEVLAAAREKAENPPGLFTLTAPTGGGKTLSSLAFALRHAVRHELARIVYVIPFTSIVEQTAAVFRDALGGGDDADFVIEHHGVFDEDRVGEREARDKLRLAMENWDAPIVVTTAVQFFESLFANRPSRCRKLHNIANGVVILDEAQTLPLQLLRPCVAALDELARNWRTSIVLCTATQPALAEDDGFSGGFRGVREIAPNPKGLRRRLERTRVRHRGAVDDAELAARLRESPGVLCIVNTRRHARELYESIKDSEGAAHLNTCMCARHRRDVLDAVRARLRDGEPVRLVATSLIEAGVDIDFPVVWRAEAGLESIVQAAGRCNREGLLEAGDVYVFAPAGADGAKPPRLPEVEQRADVARGVLRRHDDPLSLDAIDDYFRNLYWIKNAELDAKGILREIADRGDTFDFPFEKIAREFRMIETAMAPVIVPYRGVSGDDRAVDRLIEELKRVERPGRIARRLQPWTAQVPERALGALCAAGAVKRVRESEFGAQFAVLCNADLYRPDVGLTWDDPTFLDPASLVP